jgi:glycosyltransferase involved in cell wall biosynthesis
MVSDGHLGPVKRSRSRALLRELVTPLLLRLYDGFLTVGDENERMYDHFGVSSVRMFRTPFTIDESLYLRARNERTARRAQLRSELGIGEKVVVFLFVGKLAAHKRPMDFVEATLRFAAECPDSKFISILCGDGGERVALTARIGEAKDKVRIAGFVNVDQLPDFYAAADILVQPSDADNHPLTLSEAACMGLPMIVSNHIGAIGPTDIARPEQNTIIYPCGNVGKLAAAMQRLDKRSAAT